MVSKEQIIAFIIENNVRMNDAFNRRAKLKKLYNEANICDNSILSELYGGLINSNTYLLNEYKELMSKTVELLTYGMSDDITEECKKYIMEFSVDDNI